MVIKKVASASEGIELGFDLIRARIESADLTRLAISGGSTPYPLYKKLNDFFSANDSFLNRIKVCWVDERVVPYSSERSNYGNTIRNWPTLQRIHHIPFPVEDPRRIASDYLEALRDAALIEQEELLIDIVILGMGDDGHTASIFPGIEIVAKNKLAGVCYHSGFDEWRATLLLDKLKQAKQKIAFVFGKEKKSILNECIAKRNALPFSQVIDENTIIITDQDVGEA